MSTEQAGRSEDPRNLPAVPAAADLESDVLAGQAAGGPPPRAAAGPRPAVVVVQAVLVIIRHDSTKTAARHAAYIPLGAAAIARRLWVPRVRHPAGEACFVSHSWSPWSWLRRKKKEVSRAAKHQVTGQQGWIFLRSFVMLRRPVP
jgi:hypothetical protein